MRVWLVDLTCALRVLRRQPMFSLFATATLGLGIGAATLVFSIVNAVLLRELPFDEPERLAWMYNLRTERDRAPLSAPDLEDYRRSANTLAGFAAFTNWTTNLTGRGQAERLEGTRVSGNFFPLLGATTLLGRTLRPEDEAGDGRVAVLTYGLWQRRFGGDASIAGQGVSLSGAVYTVVGVMPPEFVFPFRDAELAVPLALQTDSRRSDRGANFLRVVTRLRPNVTHGQAGQELNAIARRLQTEFPNENSRKTGISLYPLHSEIVRDYEQVLWTLFAAVMILLTIAGGNLTNLMLVRAIGRTSELHLRSSLGATSGRIARQLGLEAAVLAAAAAAIGLAITAIGLGVWRAIRPVAFQRMNEISADMTVLAFGIGLGFVVALSCAAIPARSALVSLRTGAMRTERGMTHGRGHRATRRLFVVLQVACSVVLLVSMSLVVRAFARLEAVGPGFDVSRALSFQVSLPPDTHGTPGTITLFYERLSERLAALPGVQATGAVSLMPLTGLLSAVDIAFPDRPAPPPEEVPQAHLRIASPGYLSAAGIRVLGGRESWAADTASGQPVAIVSRTFAERHWPGERAIGKALRVAPRNPSPLREVVGVVDDVKQFGLDGSPTADLYLPLHQMPAAQAQSLAARMYWIVRTEGDEHRLMGLVRQAVESVDPEVATSALRTLEDVLAASLNAPRTNARVLEVFSGAAVCLCAIGIYAVAAFSAGTRQRELAIRAALGASRHELRRAVIFEEMRPLAGGVAIGLIGAMVIAPRLGPLLFDVPAHDAVTYVGVGLGLLAVGLMSIAVPAVRASRANPARLLRA